MKKVTVIVVAAGEGRRFGFAKQFALLKGKPVLDWCLDTFEAHKKVKEVVLVLKDDSVKQGYLERYGKIVAVTRGGEKRQDSVLSGFRQINPEKAGIVLVHDGARSLVSENLINRVIQATLEKGAVVPAVPVKDTIKFVEGKEVSQTLEREKLFRIQTPQGFFYHVLKTALDKAQEDRFYGTDEASLVERTGERVCVVEGDPKNIKITTPDDLSIAEVYLGD